jgi:hypothetical protein
MIQLVWGASSWSMVPVTSGPCKALMQNVGAHPKEAEQFCWTPPGRDPGRIGEGAGDAKSLQLASVPRREDVSPDLETERPGVASHSDSVPRLKGVPSSHSLRLLDRGPSSRGRLL